MTVVSFRALDAKLQHDPALLRIIGGDRLPDPTTAGDG